MGEVTTLASLIAGLTADDRWRAPEAFLARADAIDRLDLYLSGTGFRILPVVARVAPGFSLTLNPAEVDEAFEVPLAFLMAEENHQRHSREWKGLMRTYYAMPFGDRYIWGVTAGILRNLYERIFLG